MTLESLCMLVVLFFVRKITFACLTECDINLCIMACMKNKLLESLCTRFVLIFVPVITLVCIRAYVYNTYLMISTLCA